MAANFGQRLAKLNPRRVSQQQLMVTIAVVLVLYFIGPLVFVTLASTFRGPPTILPFDPLAYWTLDNLHVIYTTGRLQSTVTDTFIFVIGSVAVSFIIGLALAWLVERTDMPFRNIVYVIVFLPLIMPALVTTIGWIVLLGQRNGLVNVLIRKVLWFWDIDKGPIDPFTLFPGMIFVQGLGGTVIMFVFLSAAFRQMDSSFEEASRASGATFLQTIRRITVPIMRPSVLSVLFLGMILTLESFEIPLLMGSSGNVADILATRVYFALNPVTGGTPLYGEVSAYGIHFLIITYALFYLYARFTRRAERYATVTARGFRPSKYSLGNLKWVAFAAVIFIMFLKSIAPLLILVWASFFSSYRPIEIAALEFANLNNYRIALDDPRFWPAVRNSLALALGAATISVSIALVIAWTTTRAKKNTIWHTLIDLFTSSSLAIPGVVAASAMLLFYLFLSSKFGIPLYGTMWMLVLAFSYRMTLAYRLNRAGIAQVARELEESSSTSGANALTTLRQIVVPLIAPNVLTAWAILFIISFREFTVALFLAPSQPITLGVLLWSYRAESVGKAAAMSVMLAGFLLIVIVTVRFGALKKLARRRG